MYSLYLYIVIIIILLLQYECSTIFPSTTTVYNVSTVPTTILPTTSTTTLANSANSQNGTNMMSGNATISIAPNSTKVVVGLVTPSSTANLFSSISLLTTPDTSCYLKEDWEPAIYQKGKLCVSSICAKEMIETLDLYIQCNSWRKPEEPQLISNRVSDYLLLRAMRITTESKHILRERISSRKQMKHFATEYGFVRKTFHVSHTNIKIDFREYNILDWLSFPPSELEEEFTSFQCTIYEEVYRVKDKVIYYPEETELRKALEKLPLQISIGDEKIVSMLNSRILVFTLDPPKTHFRDYAHFRLYYRDPTRTTNHRCVRMVGEFWSDSGCYPHQITKLYIECRCETFVGRYAVLSDETAVPPVPVKLERNIQTDILMLLAGFGMLSAFASILLPYMLKCSHLGGMVKVYVISDLTYALYCAVFLIGVMKSDDLKMVNLLAAALHFLHHASITWIVVEGVHLYHSISPLYSDVIGMIFFYSTLAFGLSAALAGAAMGYDFQFTGETQYIWPFAHGIESVYIFIPTLGVLLLLIAIDILLVYELMSWIDSKYEYIYSRSVIFIKRATGYTFVFCITHFLGVSSMQTNGKGAFPFLFLGFFGIQAICILYHHFISNVECWAYREIQQFKKELAVIKEMKARMGKGEDDSTDDSDSSDNDDDNDDGDDDRKGSKDEKKDFEVINITDDENKDILKGDLQSNNNHTNINVSSPREDINVSSPREVDEKSLIHNSQTELVKRSSSQDTIRRESPLPPDPASSSLSQYSSQKSFIRSSTPNVRQSPTIPEETDEQNILNIPETDDLDANKPETEDLDANEPETKNLDTEAEKIDNSEVDANKENNETNINNTTNDSERPCEERPPSQASIASTVSNNSVAAVE